MNDLQLIMLDNTDVTGWDFSALRSELQSKLDYYSSLVYTDEAIKDAKSDRAMLNKVKKAIEDARKAYKARCLAPYEAMEPQIKELVEMVEAQRLLIDNTVKDYEERQKREKEIEVRKYYDRKAVSLGSLADALYPLLLDNKWLNASTARVKYEEGIQDAINRACADIEEIKALGSPYTDTLLQLYAETLSIDAVLAKNTELMTAADNAGLTAQATASPAPEEKETVIADSSEGVAVRIYADKKKLEQIFDFMSAIGAEYELL